MAHILELSLTLVILFSSGQASLFLRRKGPLSSFYEAGDTYIDLIDDFDPDGVDIDVAGHNFNIFTKSITHLRCFDVGFCECGTADITTTIPMDLPTVTPANSGLSLTGRCLIAPYVYKANNNNDGQRYHLAIKQLNSADGKSQEEIERISEELSLALNIYPGSWIPTNAIKITWRVQERAEDFVYDHFQAILASSDDGTTYLLYIYDTLTEITDPLDSNRGMVTSGGADFARACPQINMYTGMSSTAAATDIEMRFLSNYNCANPGTYVFAIKDASACNNPTEDCGLDSDRNCHAAIRPADTCRETYRCVLDDPATTATLMISMYRYKYARVQAIDRTIFIGAGNETEPEGVTVLKTEATCGIDLPNPSTDTDTPDSFNITVTWAAPECGFVVDEAECSIKFAFRNYDGDGTGGASDVNHPFDQEGDHFFWGTCDCNDLTLPDPNMIDFNPGMVPTSIPVRSRSLTLKTVNLADTSMAGEITEAPIGMEYYLQICYDPGSDFNLNADYFGVWVPSCKASNDATFPPDNPASYERTVEFITGGCPVSSATIGAVSTKKSFEVDSNSNTPGGEWCIYAGPFIASRWSLYNGGALADKIFFQCVCEFCALESEVLCSDSCDSDPITRKRRSSAAPSETVYTSLTVTDSEEKKDCLSFTIAISTIVALNVVLIIAVTMATLLVFKIRTERKRVARMARRQTIN